jgi:hypothetical protein
LRNEAYPDEVDTMRQDGRSVDQRTLDDFQQRRTRMREQTKPLGGDASGRIVDVLVWLLDEATVLEEQLRAYDLPSALRDEALSVCRQIAASGSRHALDLIDVRERLIRRGIAL